MAARQAAWRRGRSTRTVAAVVLLVGAGAAVSLAQGSGDRSTGDRPDKGGRYVMNPVDGGFLRMDTDTGMVSLCGKKGGGWSCDTVPDDYQALRKDADRLAQENADLRRENSDLRGGGVGPRADRGADRDRDRGKLELPSEEEIDKAISQVDKYLKKFKGLIEKYGGREEPGRQL